VPRAGRARDAGPIEPLWLFVQSFSRHLRAGLLGRVQHPLTSRPHHDNTTFWLGIKLLLALHVFAVALLIVPARPPAPRALMNRPWQSPALAIIAIAAYCSTPSKGLFPGNKLCQPLSDVPASDALSEPGPEGTPLASGCRRIGLAYF